MTAELTPVPQFGLVAYYDMQDATGSSNLSELSGVIPPMPGALGDPATGGYALTWVWQCQLACTVQGNFRPAAPTWTPTDSSAYRNARPQGLALRVWPNPVTAAGGTAALAFATPQAGPVRVRVFDMLGSERTEGLTTADLPAGPHTLPLPVGQLPQGLYLVVVESGTTRESIRLQIIL